MRKQFYSTTSAARLCQVSRGSILRWIRAGRIKTATTIGGHHRIPIHDLLNLMQTLGLETPQNLLPASSQKKEKRVLIVDDDPGICALIKKALLKLPEKIICDETHDGLRAGWLLSKVIPDLVILDLEMPNVDGYEVCKFLHSEKSFCETKILAISTHEPKKVTRILKMGADSFLSKPFEVPNLLKKVKDLLLLKP